VPPSSFGTWPAFDTFLIWQVAFNATSGTPIIAVGDDHGCVTTMKPSPNLRWTAVTKAAAEQKAKEEAEVRADRIF